MSVRNTGSTRKEWRQTGGEHQDAVARGYRSSSKQRLARQLRWTWLCVTRRRMLRTRCAVALTSRTWALQVTRWGPAGWKMVAQWRFAAEESTRTKSSANEKKSKAETNKCKSKRTRSHVEGSERVKSRSCWVTPRLESRRQGQGEGRAPHIFDPYVEWPGSDSERVPKASGAQVHEPHGDGTRRVVAPPRGHLRAGHWLSEATRHAWTWHSWRRAGAEGTGRSIGALGFKIWQQVIVAMDSILKTLVADICWRTPRPECGGATLGSSPEDLRRSWLGGLPWRRDWSALWRVRDTPMDSIGVSGEDQSGMTAARKKRTNMQFTRSRERACMARMSGTFWRARRGGVKLRMILRKRPSWCLRKSFRYLVWLRWRSEFFVKMLQMRYAWCTRARTGWGLTVPCRFRITWQTCVSNWSQDFFTTRPPRTSKRPIVWSRYIWEKLGIRHASSHQEDLCFWTWLVQMGSRTSRSAASFLRRRSSSGDISLRWRLACPFWRTSVAWRTCSSALLVASAGLADLVQEGCIWIQGELDRYGGKPQRMELGTLFKKGSMHMLTAETRHRGRECRDCRARASTCEIAVCLRSPCLGQAIFGSLPPAHDHLSTWRHHHDPCHGDDRPPTGGTDNLMWPSGPATARPLQGRCMCHVKWFGNRRVDTMEVGVPGSRERVVQVDCNADLNEKLCLGPASKVQRTRQFRPWSWSQQCFWWFSAVPGLTVEQDFKVLWRSRHILTPWLRHKYSEESLPRVFFCVSRRQQRLRNSKQEGWTSVVTDSLEHEWRGRWALELQTCRKCERPSSTTFADFYDQTVVLRTKITTRRGDVTRLEKNLLRTRDPH